jgi:hypothetical protein
MTTLATKYKGSLALRLTGVEELIARSATFQKRTGAPTIAAAKDKIYGGELTLLDVIEMVDGGTLEVARPCAIIGTQSHMYSQIGQGGSILLGASGAVWVLFVDNPSDPASYKLSLYDFCDWTSAVMDDVAELCGDDVGADDYTLWPFSAAHMFVEPFRQDLMDRKSDDYLLVGYSLADAIDGGA